MEAPVRLEIAAAAARLIADAGLDYGSAKQRAAREVLGDGRPPRGALPDNDEIDAALLEHLTLFDDEHPIRLAHMREVALQLMDDLAAFSPLATGAVWKGIATEHAPIHLQLFHDNGKEVQFHLINRKVDFEAVTVPHFRTGEDVEAYACLWQGEAVLLSVYDDIDKRGALRSRDGNAVRGDRAALLRLVESAAAA